MKIQYAPLNANLVLLAIAFIIPFNCFSQRKRKHPRWEKGLKLQLGYSDITSTYDPTPGQHSCDEGCEVYGHLPFFGGYIGWDAAYSINRQIAIHTGIGLFLNLYRQQSWTGNGGGGKNFHRHIGPLATSIQIPITLTYQSINPRTKYKPYVNLGSGLDIFPHYYIIHVNTRDVPVSRYTGFRFQTGMGVLIPLRRKTMRLGATFSMAMTNYSPFKTHRYPEKSVLRPYLIGLEMGI